MTLPVSPAIEIVCGLAEREAAAADFAAVEPEHLMLALLHFAEIPPMAIPFGPQANESVRAAVKAEAQAVAEYFRDLKIEVGVTRREMRSAVGRGPSSTRRAMLHRSASTRAYFDAAERWVSSGAAEALTAPLLVRALLERPTATVSKILGPVQSEPTVPTPAIAKPAAGVMPGVGARPSPIYRAVIDCLATDNAKSVLLVGDPQQAQPIISAITSALENNDVPRNLRGKRILNLFSLDPKQVADLEATIRDAAGSPNSLLVLPAWTDQADVSHLPRFASGARGAIERYHIQCIWAICTGGYETLTAQQASWKRITSVIWMTSHTPSEIPWEL